MIVTSGVLTRTGKGRCWHCDAKLPRAQRAIREGWDVQRIDDHPVASIILVCPTCVNEQEACHRKQGSDSSKVRPSADQRALHARPILAPGET